MKARRILAGLFVPVLSLGAASSALALANRVFVSARSGSDANSCDSVATPCLTLAGAVAQLNPDGEVIVLDSGGYGKVTITHGMTIEAPAGVTAFIHPSSGDAITINAASSDTVTLRGLALNAGANNGITVNSVGTLNVENSFINGFASNGIAMNSAGQLNVMGTSIKKCGIGVLLQSSTGLIRASVDHCHFDGNSVGYFTATFSSGSSTTTVTNSTANGNQDVGWICGNASNGKDLLNLQSCTGSENGQDGLVAASGNALSSVRYSNCIFANNGHYGVNQFNSASALTRGDNTITGNGLGQTSGTIGPFSPI